jgi:dTDP-4-dehydrorhamnose 3,5-epimerase
MRFIPTALPGVVLVETPRVEDPRGGFERSYCADLFAAAGLPPLGTQCNISSNRHRLTLRGMHFQAAPEPDAKLVRCLSGRMFDVAVDIRPGSPTRGRWAAVELAAGDGRSLFVPAGFAHGFVTLEDDTTVFYMMGAAYRPALARGFRWDDPRVAIAWPVAPQTISERDRALPALDDLDEAELAR